MVAHPRVLTEPRARPVRGESLSRWIVLPCAQAHAPCLGWFDADRLRVTNHNNHSSPGGGTDDYSGGVSHDC